MQTCGTILFLALFGSQVGAVCNVPRPRLVCAEYANSKAVVIAKLTNIKYVTDKHGYISGTYYSMTVEQALRSQTSRLFRVFESNDSGRATFDWKLGDSYLLFLTRKNPDGAWVIDGCGNSGPSARRDAALKQIEAIDETSDRALIQGAVGGNSSSVPLAGVQIEATGPGGVNTAETKADGTFTLHVVTGKYQVRALAPGTTFVSDDFTYESPDRLVLESGGCAQVQFVEATAKPNNVK